MSDDAELKAMSALVDAMEPLDEIARQRVLGWLAARYGGAPSSTAGGRVAPQPPHDVGQGLDFGEFADLYAAASPSSDKERALVAAFWVQVKGSQANFASQTLNSILKDLGYGVGNITDALEALKDERPALILQLKKSGTSKQARKTYKMTTEGTKKVLQMINGAV